ncbi:hypothetical protein GCM10020221_03260 [Streptomyces thioluteus]|uniref:Uncharacterized protein n=1 Tax=Streptomyces thioluteus TaxID=66431 RepID=A0ABN3WDD2_STRTU
MVREPREMWRVALYWSAAMRGSFLPAPFLKDTASGRAVEAVGAVAPHWYQEPFFEAATLTALAPATWAACASPARPGSRTEAATVAAVRAVRYRPGR